MVGGHDPVLWWIAGDDADELEAQLDEREAGSPSHPAGESSGPARLGIVDPSDRKIRLARRLLREGAPWRGRGDVWLRPGPVPGPGRLAFLFPGVEPNFAPEGLDLHGLARQVGLDGEVPSLAVDTLARQSASIYRLGVFLDRVLRRLGVEPDVIAGHSLGEWSGTVAAGIVGGRHADDLVGGLDLDTVELPQVDFVALSAGADAVAPVLRGLDDVVVSHDNSPRQSIICAPPDVVDEALQRLRDVGILGYKLDFRSGFHTPFVAPLLEDFRRHLDTLELHPPMVSLWSATLAAPYPADPVEIAALHMRHLVEPVRFRPLVERLYHDAGVRIFLQVGMGSLTSFVDDTLQDHDHLSLALVHPKHSAVAQVQRALTALWVEGLPVRPLANRPVDEPVIEPKVRAELAVAASASSVTMTSRVRAAADMVALAAHCGQDVLAALSARLLPEAEQLAAPAAPAAPAVPAVPGWPTERIVLTRRLSLDTMPETLDHSLFALPEGWPDPSDGFPIVAMTTQIQLLQDLAVEHAGGREVVEVFGVRNMRWLDLSEPQDVEVTIVPKSDGVLGVALGTYCRVDVRFGDRAPAAPRYEARPLLEPRPTRHTAREMFDKRIMFHGPRFQGITTLGPTGEDGILGSFHNLDTPGSLLDNFGKLVAYWVIDRRGLGESPLPIGVDKIELFGPTPPPGVDLHCDVRIVELHDSLVRADGVIVHPDGSVWCHVHGWTSHIFHLDLVTEPVYRDTARSFMAEPQAGGWNVVVERWPTGAGRDLTARRFLTGSERSVYERLNLLEQRRWLIDVVAVKDSVRRWLADSFDIASYPVEITVVPDGERRFRVAADVIPAGHDPCVTVASLQWLAVTVVGDGAYRDVDARVLTDTDHPDAVAAEVADAVRSRNPNDVVGVATHAEITPSTIEVVTIPRLAVAWTECPDISR